MIDRPLNPEEFGRDDLPVAPRRVLLAVGTLAGLGAVVVAFTGITPPGTDPVVDAVRNPVVVIMVAFVVVVLGLRESYEATEWQPTDPPFGTPPERATHHDGPLAGGSVDGSYEVLTDPDPDVTRREYQRHRASVRRELRDAAIEALADARDISVREARDRVDEGTWTDDPRVAAFLGARAPEPPLSVRVQDWLGGRRDSRRVEAAIEEIRALAAVPGVETGDRSSRDSEGSVERSGVGAGRVPITDDSMRDSTTVTTVDAGTDDASKWDLGVVVAFLLAGLGLALRRTTLVLGAVVALAYAVYGHVTRPPAMTLDVTRAVGDGSPVPGEPVDVTLTVENVGDHPIPEVRVVDGVPDELPVFGGTPRACGSLRPGESLSTTYSVEALRGDHEFGPATVWTRNVSGETEREASADLEASLSCRDVTESVPLSTQTTPYTGRIPTDSGGPGVEFYATREYQSTDPLKQIDWNHWARTGEPRTVEFRQNRAATVVILLDDRRRNRRSRHEWSPDAVSLGRHAAARMADGLLDESNAVGAATLRGERYVSPGRGRQQLRRVRAVLVGGDGNEEEDGTSVRDVDEQYCRGLPAGGRVDEYDPTPEVHFGMLGDGGVGLEWLRKRLPGDAQVLFVTPLLDDRPEYVARRLGAEGHDVTVVSPDVTDWESPGSTIARIERHERLRRLRRRQFRAVDWPTESPLSVALERAREGWSQ